MLVVIVIIKGVLLVHLEEGVAFGRTLSRS